MVASFASLPAELVSRVVGMVYEQDRAWRPLAIRQGDRYRTADEAFAPGVSLGENISLGRWSPGYGQGIRALVRVDRRTRRAAVPFLYKSITIRAANAPYFRVKVLGHELGQLVHELECVSVKPEQVVSLAAALEGLPNLSSIIVDGNSLDMLQQGGVGHEQELLAQAMKSALGRITSLEIEYARASGVGGALALARALEHVDKRRLRRLVVEHAECLVPLAQELVRVLEGFEGLVDVELDASNEELADMMRERLRLPHLRTLGLTTSGEMFEPEYSDGLLLASQIAPSLEILSFHNLDTTCASHRPSRLPRRLLPSLRVLRIDINDSLDLDNLYLDHLPALEHLDISSCTTDGNIFPDEVSIPAFPPTLRAITIANSLTVPSSPSASLVAKYDELGIRIRASWSPPALYVARRMAEDSVPTLGAAFEAPDEEDAVELKRLFDWASARAGWLLRVGDGRGLGELGAAAMRVRERFVIEHS